MQQPSPLAQAVEDAITELLAHVGYDVILVEFMPVSGLLRLYIDVGADLAAQQDGALASDVASEQALLAAAPKERTITLEDCTKVSRLVSDVLDAEGLMESVGGYRLEVSSPGLDRPLVKPQHFRRFVGQPVRLRTRVRLEGIELRRFEATLLAADDDGIAIAFGETQRHIPYADLDKAQLVPTF